MERESSNDRLQKHPGQLVTHSAEISYLLLQNGDNHSQIHPLAGMCLCSFHLRGEGVLLSRQVFAGSLLRQCLVGVFFKEVKGIDCSISPYFSQVFLSLPLHSAQMGTPLCLPMGVKKKNRSIDSTPLHRPGQVKTRINSICIIMYILIYRNEMTGASLVFLVLMGIEWLKTEVNL